jgi:hypothetical protein
LETYDIDFQGNIACAAHVINLIIQDILSALKLNPPKIDEFFEFTEENERIKNRAEIEREQGGSKLNFI